MLTSAALNSEVYLLLSCGVKPHPWLTTPTELLPAGVEGVALLPIDQDVPEVPEAPEGKKEEPENPDSCRLGQGL